MKGFCSSAGRIYQVSAEKQDPTQGDCWGYDRHVGGTEQKQCESAALGVQTWGLWWCCCQASSHAGVGGEHQHEDERYWIQSQEVAQLARDQPSFFSASKNHWWGSEICQRPDWAAAGGVQLQAAWLAGWVMKVVPKVLQGFWVPFPSTPWNRALPAGKWNGCHCHKGCFVRLGLRWSVHHVQINFSCITRDNMALSMQKNVRQGYTKHVLVLCSRCVDQAFWCCSWGNLYVFQHQFQTMVWMKTELTTGNKTLLLFLF